MKSDDAGKAYLSLFLDQKPESSFIPACANSISKSIYQACYRDRHPVLWNDVEMLFHLAEEALNND